MSSHFIHMTNNKKKHDRFLTTKTLETNITTGTGEEKSNTLTYKFDSEYRKKFTYLRGIELYLRKKMTLKYNILPNEYTLFQLENFITGKYCRALASFKEKLMFYYVEEFLKRYYKYPEIVKKLPLFYEFYKSYLKFFCSPTLSDLKLNELIENMVEKKAKAFYNENFKEDKPEKKTKIISTIIFSNKIRREISRRNTLTDLSKTTIVNNNLSNKSSITSIGIINMLLSELSPNKNKIDNNKAIKKIKRKIGKESIKETIKEINKINALDKPNLQKGVFFNKFKKLSIIKNTEQLIKVSKCSSKNKDLSISVSGKLKTNNILKEIKKNSTISTSNMQINKKRLFHKKTAISRNFENTLENKQSNNTQNITNNNHLQSMQSYIKTPIQGYGTTRSNIKSKTKKILKIPKHQINANQGTISNHNLLNENKNIIYNYNTSEYNNKNNILNNNFFNIGNIYSSNNTKKTNSIIKKSNVTDKKMKTEVTKVLSVNSLNNKKSRVYKNISPSMLEGALNNFININNSEGLYKISKLKINTYKMIQHKNYIINPKKKSKERKK